MLLAAGLLSVLGKHCVQVSGLSENFVGEGVEVFGGGDCDCHGFLLVEKLFENVATAIASKIFYRFGNH